MIRSLMNYQGAGNSAEPTNDQLVKPSDCPDGTLKIWFPDGTSTSVPGVVACCYSYPNCDPCHGHNYDVWIGEHFTKQCGTNNSKGCYHTKTCNL